MGLRFLHLNSLLGAIGLSASLIFTPQLSDAHGGKFFKKHHGRRHAASWNHQGPTPPAGSCPMPFNESARPFKVTHSHIYIDLKNLNFLKSPYGFYLQDVELRVNFKNYKNYKSHTLRTALNGQKVSHQGGTPGGINKHGYVSFELENLYLNGAESFHKYMLRLKKNKGILKISILGRHGQIQGADVIFRGIAYNHCGSTSTTTTSTSTTTSTLAFPTTTTTTLPGEEPPSTTTTTTTLPAPTTTTTTTTTTLPPEDLSKYQVRIDSVNPSQSPTASTNMVIYFSAANLDGSFYCSIDQGAYEKCQSPVSYAGLSNGNHIFQVYSETPRGTLAGDIQGYSWIVDTVPPVVSITNLGSLSTLTNQASITFEFTSTKSGTFRCSLDGGAATACQSPMTYSGLSEGLHRFSVTAIDTVGNVSGSPAQFNWSVDLTAPRVNLIAVQPQEPITRSTSKTFTFASDETSNYQCSLDQGTFTACESPLTLGSLAEGDHLLQVRATDLAGNTGPETSYSWTNDYTAPEVMILTSQPPAGLINSASAAVDFTTSETSTAFCQLNGGTPVACSSPYTASFTADGNYELAIYAIDTAGNQGTPQIVSWVVDRTAPQISFARILPSEAIYQRSNSFSFEINASEVAGLNASLNGVALSSVTNPLSLTGLSDGSYVLQVSGFDAAGNLSNTITHDFVVDTTPPVFSIAANGASLDSTDSRTFQFTANESVTYECSLDEAGYEPCTAEQTYSGFADGDHFLVVRASDLAGNTSTRSHSWSIDTAAPRTFQSNTGNTSSGNITFTLTSDESPVTYLCSLDGASESSCSSPVSYSGLSVGNHTFTARAVDAAGNVDPVGVTHAFTILEADSVAPSITAGPSFSVTNNSITVTWSLNEAATGQVLYGVGTNLNQATVETTTTATSYSIRITGLTASTTYSVQVTGRDAAGNVYRSSVLTARTSR